jgi:hypothetical protein
MGNSGNKVIHLDIRGRICPSTLLIAPKEINRHKDGTAVPVESNLSCIFRRVAGLT